MTFIDVSKWQGAIDWPRVANEGGVTCAVMRATLGATGFDDRFDANWQGSRVAGIARRGVYHYVITSAPAAGQLNNILATTGGDFGTEPVTLDVERTSAEVKAMQAGWQFPKTAYTAMLLELVNGLAQRVPVRIYTSKWEWLAMTTMPAWAASYPLWVAGYPLDPNNTAYRPAVPAPWADWTVWQYTADGHVPGITGAVDMSREKVVTPPSTVAIEIAGHARAIKGLVV